MNIQDYMAAVIELAEETEIEDPIDWGMLNIDEHAAYQLMAAGVLEDYLNMAPDHRELLLLATVVKLTVENFTLHVKLNQR